MLLFRSKLLQTIKGVTLTSTLIAVLLSANAFAATTYIDLNNNGSINQPGGNVSGTHDSGTGVYNMTIKNPVTNNIKVSNANSTIGATTITIVSDGSGSAAAGDDVTLSQFEFGSYGYNKITLKLNDSSNQGKVKVDNIFSSGLAFFANGLDIVLSDEGYGSAVGSIDFSTGLHTHSSVTTKDLIIQFQHVNATTGTAQVTGNVDFSNIEIESAGITVDDDMTGYNIIGGSYTGCAGVDTFTYTGSATIAGAVDMGAGSNVIILGNGKTATMSGGLKATGGSIEIQGGTGTEVLAADIDFSDDNAHELSFTTDDTTTLSGSITGGVNNETLTFTNTATVSGAVALGSGSDAISVETGKQATLGSTFNITAADSAAATVTLTGAGNFTVSGTTTLTGTSSDTAEFQVDSTATNSLSGIVLAGGASSKALLDINDGTANTATKLTVSADKYGTLDVATDQTTFTVTTTEVKSGGTLKVVAANTDEDINLGALTISGGTFDVADASRAATVKLDSLTINNGNVTINGDKTTAADIIKIASGTIDLQSTLIYDSTAVKFVDSSDNAITITGSTIDLGGSAEDPDYSSGDTQEITNTGKVTDIGLDDNTKTRTAEVANESTVVATSTQTVQANNTLKIDYGSTYIQNSGSLSASAGKVILDGELNIAGDASTVGTLDTDGTTGTITGKTVTVTTLNIEADEKINVAGTITLGAANNVVGAVELVGETKDESGIIDINDASSTFATFNVGDGKYGVIHDSVAGSADALTVNGGTIKGHLKLDENADIIIDGGALKISSNTLDMANGSSVTINATGYIADADPDDQSHITVISSGAANTATIDNKSTQSANELNWLEVKTTSNSSAGATLNFDNTSGNAAVVDITKIDVTSFAGHADNDATLNLQNSAGGGSQTITVSEINITDTADSQAKVDVQNDVATTIATLNFKGGTDGTFDNGSTGAVTITNTNVDATTAGAAVTGVIDTTIATTTTLSNVTLTGDGANNAALTIDESGGAVADVANIGVLTLAGAGNVDDATLTVDGNASDVNIADVQVAAGKYGTITNTANTSMKNATINGTLNLAAAATIGDGASGRFTVGSTGSLTTGAGALTLASGGELYVTAPTAAGHTSVNTAGNSIVTTNGKLYLDMGTGTDGTTGTGKYARIDNSDDITVARTGTTITSVYGVNGISGTTYADVFMTTTAGVANDDVLATADDYRIYTLKNAAANIYDIEVTTNTSGINDVVIRNGGTIEGSNAASYLVENESSLTTEGQEFVKQLTALTGANFARGADETAGVEATTQTAQSAQHGVQESISAVGRQMTSFRNGSLSAGMTSSFGSGGATAALNDMADAETLADAYDSASGDGYTAAAEGTYKKVQVWANGYGGFGEQASDGDMEGYDFYNVGVMAGLDYAFAKEFRLGALFGYTHNDTDIYSDRGNSKDNVLRFGGYGSFNWNSFFVDMTSSAGIHMINSKRKLITNGLTAKGDRTGIDFNVAGTLGYTFVLPAEFQLTPSYSLSYTMFYDPDYTETDAGAGNLSVNSFTSNSLVQNLGVKIGKLFCISDTLSLLPEAWGGWEVEYLNTGGDRNSTTTAAIGTQSYSTTMNGMATHRGYWGAGMTALINDDISVYGRYDHKIWDKGYNVGFTAGIKVAF